MKKLLSALTTTTVLGTLATAGTIALHQEAVAQGYDIDCKVILCLAGGFPQGCANAKSYMIDRITSVPPKPPFGFCAFSNGDGFDDYEAPFRFLSGRDSFLCPEGSNLFYQPRIGGEIGQDEVAFCFTRQVRNNFSFNQFGGRFADNDFFGQTNIRSNYEGVTDPLRVNYRISITLKPGAADEFRSPIFFGNTGTGFVTQRPS